MKLFWFVFIYRDKSCYLKHVALGTWINVWLRPLTSYLKNNPSPICLSCPYTPEFHEIPHIHEMNMESCPWWEKKPIWLHRIQETSRFNLKSEAGIIGATKTTFVCIKHSKRLNIKRLKIRNKGGKKLEERLKIFPQINVTHLGIFLVPVIVPYCTNCKYMWSLFRSKHFYL